MAEWLQAEVERLVRAASHFDFEPSVVAQIGQAAEETLLAARALDDPTAPALLAFPKSTDQNMVARATRALKVALGEAAPNRALDSCEFLASTKDCAVEELAKRCGNAVAAIVLVPRQKRDDQQLITAIAALAEGRALHLIVMGDGPGDEPFEGELALRNRLTRSGLPDGLRSRAFLHEIRVHASVDQCDQQFSAIAEKFRVSLGAGSDTALRVREAEEGLRRRFSAEVASIARTALGGDTLPEEVPVPIEAAYFQEFRSGAGGKAFRATIRSAIANAYTRSVPRWCLPWHGFLRLMTMSAGAEERFLSAAVSPVPASAGIALKAGQNAFDAYRFHAFGSEKRLSNFQARVSKAWIEANPGLAEALTRGRKEGADTVGDIEVDGLSRLHDRLRAAVGKEAARRAQCARPLLACVVGMTIFWAFFLWPVVGLYGAYLAYIPSSLVQRPEQTLPVANFELIMTGALLGVLPMFVFMGVMVDRLVGSRALSEAEIAVEAAFKASDDVQQARFRLRNERLEALRLLCRGT